MKFKTGKLPQDNEEKLRYLYRFQELLRLFHNQKGKEFREGKITEHTFRKFQRGWFEKRNFLLCKEIDKCKDKIPEIVAERKIPPWERTKNACAKYEASEHDKTIVIDITDIEEE